jgi:hypothetical protein
LRFAFGALESYHTHEAELKLGPTDHIRWISRGNIEASVRETPNAKHRTERWTVDGGRLTVNPESFRG